MTFKSELTTRIEQIQGLTLTSTHVGVTEKQVYLEDRWIVILEYGEHIFDTKFGTGMGHRIKPRWIECQGKGYYNKQLAQFKSEKDAAKSGWLKLVHPKLDDVIHSLLVDSSCAEGTFEDYCSEFGLDTDSRKALDIYLSCQKTRSAMIKMFGHELFAELSRLSH